MALTGIEKRGAKKGKVNGYQLFSRDLGVHGSHAGPAWKALSEEKKTVCKNIAKLANDLETHRCGWVLSRGKCKGEQCNRIATCELASGWRCARHVNSKKAETPKVKKAETPKVKVTPDLLVVTEGSWETWSPKKTLKKAKEVGECACILKKGRRTGSVCGRPTRGGDRCRNHVGK
jgi:hypothetical protein